MLAALFTLTLVLLQVSPSIPRPPPPNTDVSKWTVTTLTILKRINIDMFIHGNAGKVQNPSTINTPEGQEHLLDGYAAHDEFMSNVVTLFQYKVKLATERLLTYSTIDSGQLLSNIDVNEYTILQLLDSLSENDATHSNQLLEVASKIKTNQAPIVSEWVRTKIHFPTDKMYRVIDSIVNGHTLGLNNVPRPIIRDILLMANKSELLMEACKRGDEDTFHWLQKTGLDGLDLDLNEALLEAWKSNSRKIIQTLMRNGPIMNITNEMVLLINERNETLLQLAAESKIPESVRALLKKGAKVNGTDLDGYTPLHRAVEYNDLATVQILLDEGSNVNAETAAGDIPLHFAARNGHVGIAKLLMKSGSIIDKKNIHGLTPLYLSEQIVITGVVEELLKDNVTIPADEEDKELSFLFSTVLLNRNYAKRLGPSELMLNSKVAELLINYGGEMFVDIDLKTKLLILTIEKVDETLTKIVLNLGPDITKTNSKIKEKFLFNAIRKGTLESIKFLLNHDIDVNIKNKHGFTALHIAAKNEILPVINLLIKYGGDLEARNSHNMTPLHEAAKEGKLNAIHLLLEKGANINAQDSEGRTPLYLSTAFSHDAVTKFLLDKGANCSIRTKTAQTVLHAAASNGHSMIMRSLLNCAISTDTIDNDHRTPFLVAAASGHLTALTELLNKGAFIYAKTKESGLTAIHLAAIAGKTHIIKYLLDIGMDININSYDNRTPLFEASYWGQHDAVKLLLERGANIYSKTRDGWMPLHTAAARGHIKIVQTLLDKGSFVDVKNSDDRTPLFEASHWGHEAIVKMLLKRGADVKSKTKADGWVSLHTAASRGHVGVVKIILDEHGDLNVRNYDDRTPLFEASHWGQEVVVNELLKRGADFKIRTKADGWAALHTAAARGHLSIVTLLLDASEDVNVKNIDDRTPLFEASHWGRNDVIIHLMSKGGDINIKTKADGWLSLHTAAARGHMAIVNMFLERRMDINAKNYDDRTPLFEASHWGQEVVVKELLNRGADFKIRTKADGWAALHTAAARGHLSIVTLLLDAGEDVNVKNIDNRTPLFEASHWGRTDVIIHLMSKGGDINIKTKADGWLSFHTAAARGHMAIVNMFLERAMDVDAKNYDDRTPLFEASHWGQEVVVKELLKRGADFKIRTKADGWVALHTAAARGHLSIVTLLLDAGTDVNVKNFDDRTPLFEASHWGRTDVIIHLMSKGGDINIKTKADGWLSLHTAAARGHMAIVNMFLERRVDINAKNYDDRTPLFEASRWGHENVVKELLKIGADFKISTKADGWVALHTAAAQGHLSIVTMLLDAGADVNVKNFDGLTPLFEASHWGRDAVVRTLIKRGADVLARTVSGTWTALHTAASKGNIGVVTQLLDRNVDVDIKNKDNKTPLFEAVYWGHFDVCKLLLERGADVNTKTTSGETIQDLAKTRGHSKILRLFSK